MARVTHERPAMAAALGRPDADRRGTDEPPSIELLEYLAEFEMAGDGRLLDPLDMQRDDQQQDPPPPTDPRSTAR